MRTISAAILFFTLPLWGFSQEARFIGLINKTLVEVNPYVPSLERIVRYEFPNDGNPSDMAYSTTTCLFYTIIDAVDNPKLVSFDFLGNVELIGQFTISNGTVFTSEGIAYDEVNDLMYISGSLNGQDFFSEAIMTVDLNTAECALITRLNFSNGVSPDVDNMEIANEILYFNDGQPGPSVTDHYAIPLGNLNAGTTPILNYFQTPYSGSSDVVYFQDSLFYPALDFRLLTHVPNENNETNLGMTHSNADYSGERIRGLEYIKGLVDFNYNQQGLDTFLCNNGSVNISLDPTGLDVQWNTGETGTDITMDEEGLYYAQVLLDDCLIAITDTFTLTYLQNSEGELELFLCDNNGITVNNILYNQPGTYTQFLSSSSGVCDSTLNLNITPGDPNLEDELVFICEGENYSVGDSTYTEAGQYITTIESLIDCDSIITTELIVNLDTESFVDVFECTEEMVEVNGIEYTISGQYIQTIENAVGCDSVLNLNIQIEDVIRMEQSYELCEGDTLEIYNLVIDSSGTWEIFLASNNNLCDTIIDLNVSVNVATQGMESHTLCINESIEINGTTYSEAGIFEQDLINNDNCDSLLVVEIIVEEETNSFLEFFNCEGLPISVNEKDYIKPGLYTQVFTSKNGCDSILHILFETTSIYIPNIFSPDLAGNDTFKPFLTCEVSYYELHIFDRWGNLVFVTEEQEAAWNGDFGNAEICEQGVYVYILKYGLNEDTSIIKTGDVTLIR